MSKLFLFALTFSALQLPAVASAETPPRKASPGESQLLNATHRDETDLELSRLEAERRSHRFRGPVALMVVSGSILAVGQTIAAAAIVSGMTSGASNTAGLVVGGSAVGVGAVGLAGGIVWASKVQRRRTEVQRRIDDIKSRDVSTSDLSVGWVLTPGLSGLRLRAVF